MFLLTLTETFFGNIDCDKFGERFRGRKRQRRVRNLNEAYAPRRSCNTEPEPEVRSWFLLGSLNVVHVQIVPRLSKHAANLV